MNNKLFALRPGPAHAALALVGDCGHFLASFARSPKTVGAVAPSSRRLATAMIPPAALRATGVVVELGAGTGVVTRLLREKLPPSTALLAMEMQGSSARKLRRRLPGVHVACDTAEHLPGHLQRLGCRRTSCIISGLPWASMPGDTQERILDAVLASLRPGGTFTAMAYVHARILPASKKFKAQLDRRFARVITSPVVWANLPPAFVYYCR